MKLLIAVAGPYSADTEIRKKENLDAMNEAAARIYEKGHIPVIGVALLLIGESPGANKEKDLILSSGKKVYYDISEIPEA